ncbi:hypothetical protein B0H10DRAFT_2231971 [Mycena sp. CBHHK59/15]|nr:hypothetical protein B0H10DRAFT_2231971 [Mycena sp. CBHHK59/15]
MSSAALSRTSDFALCRGALLHASAPSVSTTSTLKLTRVHPLYHGVLWMWKDMRERTASRDIIGGRARMGRATRVRECIGAGERGAGARGGDPDILFEVDGAVAPAVLLRRKDTLPAYLRLSSLDKLSTGLLASPPHVEEET